MRFVLPAWLAALFVLSTTVRADDEADVKAAGKAYEKAVLAGDAAAMDRLLADDFEAFDADGAKLTRERFLAGMKTADAKITGITSADVKVRVYGGTAVETGRVTVTGKNGGKAFREILIFTDVWVKQGGGWKLAAEHTCRPPAR